MTQPRPCRGASAAREATAAASSARIVPFAPELLPAVRDFGERYWTRPSTPEYYDWRYLRSLPFSATLVALRDGECLGMLAALLKRYRIGGERVTCLEVFDWHVLPDLRGTGIGVRLMRAMMRQPARVVSVGGTPDALGALPLMGWGEIAVARHFELLLCGDAMATRLQRRAGVPEGIARVARLTLGPLSAAYFSPKRRRVPAGAEVQVSDRFDDRILDLYRGRATGRLAQEPDPDLLGWVTRSRWSGCYQFLTFRIHGRLHGWAMTRLYRDEQGLVGALVEVVAPQPDVPTYTWMVSEAALSLKVAGARRLKANASCPALQAALIGNRFRCVATDAPVHMWPPPRGGGREVPHFTLNHADGSFRPFECAGPARHGTPAE